MSVSIDNDPAEESEDARSVLASWLDDYIGGRCDRTDMQESFLSVCRSNPEAPWDALALLDQYQRRGRIDTTLARSLKADIAQLVFGRASQTEASQAAAASALENATEPPADTTGSRWRKLIIERDTEAAEEEEEDEELPAPPVPPAAPAFSSEPTISAEPSHLSSDPTLLRRDLDVPGRKPAPRAEPTVRPAEPAPRRSTKPNEVLRDRYELLSVLGRGSSGTVHRALDRHRAHLSESARCVAVKVLSANYNGAGALAELEREVHQAQLLAHPNVVSVFDLDKDGDTYFIVMELLEGELLADVLRRLDGQPMSRAHALNIISSVGAALAHAHRRDVVHGDLKPRNVMITRNGEIRVLDFGFARNRALDLHSASRLHEASVAAPAYASVERVNGSEPHPDDDVYSLACIAYELLSGQHPFGGRSAVLARAHGRRPPRIAGLNHKQWHVLQRALLWTRGERKIEVVDLLSGLGCAEVAGKLVPAEELVGDTRRPWRARVVAMVIFVLLAFMTFALLYSRYNLPAPMPDAVPVTSPPSDREARAVSEPPPASEAVEAPDTGTPTTQSAAKSSAQTKDQSPARSAGASEEPAQSGNRANSQSTGTVAKPAAATPAQSKPSQPATNTAATSPVMIEFEKDTYVATESDGSVRLHVRRSGSARDPVRFRWTLRGNSAEEGADFAAIGPDIEEMAAGAREVTLTIPLVSDAIIENTELFLVEIESMQDGVMLGERSHAAVIIVDDD